MKNAKNIQKITTSLFLAVTLVLGSVSFAVPGIMPSAFAATENLVVSADNNLFDKSFNGPMVIEVVVNDNDIDEEGDLEPDVTINGADLAMAQAGDGNWYAYFVAQDQAANAVTEGINFGTNSADTNAFTKNTDDIVYSGVTDVVRQSKTLASAGVHGFEGTFTNAHWPVIQAFEFAVDGSVTITYSKGGNPQSIALTYLDDPDDYAGLTLDRDSYPPGAHVHATITSMSHNIDPTDEDSWSYDTNSSIAYYQYFDENGNTNRSTADPVDTSALNFDDSGSFIIITDPNGQKVLDFGTNNDQGDDVSGIGTNVVTILETQPNSGIFKTTDDADESLIVIADGAQRGFTGTINFADDPISVPVRNYPGSLTMDVNGIGGTWNGGEEITVTLDDGDLNLNSLVDQDISLDNWAQKIPTVIIGSPLTLEDATEITVGGSVIATPPIDTFSKRASISGAPDAVVMATFAIENVNTDLFYFSNTEGELALITLTVADGETENYSFKIGDIPSDGSNLIAVGDIFIFGQDPEQLENAAVTRNANAIYRMLLEETGDNTAMYTGSIEYTALNQLNVGDSDTYAGLATIDDEITIIVPTDLTDEDAVRVDYLDTDGEGIATQIGDQVDAPTHSGIVSFDGSNYKVADTVTVTLTDADLNTDSDTTEVYTLANDTTYGDRIGEAGTGVAQSGRLLDITFDDATWTYMGCEDSDDDGLSNTGFTLSETTSTSGIFTGTFQIPANYCTSNATVSTTTGKDLEVNYVDYSDASGELIEVGDSAGISANTGSVSFDRSVYPVPFEPSEYPTQNTPLTIADADSSISGDTVFHIRVNDPDFDISGSGSDTLPADTLMVEVIRGSQSSGNLVADDTDPIKEISPTTGIFELDLSVEDTFWCDVSMGCTFTNGTFVLIEQGDIITVEYTDETDASGNENTVTDSATFDLRNAVLQTDKSAYIIGGDMILTLIEPDFDLDSDETESYPLDLIEWDSDADILAMGQSANFDPEPSALRETGDSTGIFQVVIEIPEKLPDASVSSVYS